jgi:VanZ family protein
VRRSILLLWGPFIAALGVVFWLSSLSQVPGANYFWDKLLHTLGYAGLGVLALRAFHGGFEPLRWKATLYAAIAVIVWGISDEYHQSFVPGRTASALDVCADAVGFALAALLVASFTSGSVRLKRAR